MQRAGDVAMDAIFRSEAEVAAPASSGGWELGENDSHTGTFTHHMPRIGLERSGDGYVLWQT